MRKLTIKYNVTNDFIKICLTEAKKDEVIFTTKKYNIADFEDENNFYNLLLDDFSAEYDDEKANVIDTICFKIREELQKNGK